MGLKYTCLSICCPVLWVSPKDFSAVRSDCPSVTQAHVVCVPLGKYTAWFLLQCEVVWVLFLCPPEMVRKTKRKDFFGGLGVVCF